MRKTITLCLLIAILLMVNGCSTAKDSSIIKNTDNISKITVRTQPGKDSSLKSTEDKSHITDVVNYINGLDLKKTTKDAGKYNGMSYVITIYYGDNTSTEYVHFGNMFFKESGRYWYEMSYNQAEKFEDIYNRLGSK